MKSLKSAVIGMLALTGAVLSAEDAAPAAQPAASGTPDIKLNIPDAKPTFTDEQTIEAFGWFLAHQTGLVALGFSKDEVNQLARGMSLAVAGEPSPSDMTQIGPSIQALISSRRSTALTKMRNENLAEAAKFLSEVRTKPGVVSLDDGLAYEIVKEGDGPIPTPEQYVKVNYVGRLINGSEFDRSEEGKPVEFKLNGVIPGWTEALSKIKQGSKVTLYIPPHLAYGDQGTPEIPPGSTLVFDVEILGVSDKPTMPAEAGDHAEEPPAVDASK